MDNKKYFADNQEVLLWLANTSAGKYLIGAKPQDKIVKVSPNSFHRLEAIEKDKVILTGVFKTYENVAKELLPILTMSQIAQMPVRDEAWVEHASGLEFNRKYPSVFLDTNTFYAGGGDGRIQNNTETGVGSNWAQCRASSTGTAQPTSSSNNRGIASTYKYSSFFAINREFYPVNLSAIGEAGEVTAASLNVYAEQGDGATNFTIVAVPTTQASATTLASGDFDQVGTTQYSNQVTVPYNPSPAKYYSLTLNSTAIAALSLTGYNKIGVRNYNYDLLNSEPAVDGAWVTTYYSNNTGTDKDPYYEITYTLPSGGSPMFFWII